MNSGIYCIENVENGMRYIGKSENLELRMWKNHHDCQYIGRAIKKYGGNIIRYIIEYCNKEDLTFWERYYIKEWNTKSPNGYNLTDGGEGLINPTKEVRKRMSIAASGERNANYGKKGKENHNYGRHQTDEWKKKQSERMSGEKHPMYGKRGKDSPLYGIIRSDATRKLITENHWDCSGKNNPNYGKRGKNSSKFGRKQRNASSPYNGVMKILQAKKWVYWQVVIKLKNKILFRKLYHDELEAAHAYNDYIIKHNLPHPLNIFTDKNKI